MKDNQININGRIYEEQERDGELVFVPVHEPNGKEVTVSIPLDALFMVRSILSIIAEPYDVDVQPIIFYSYWSAGYATFSGEACVAAGVVAGRIDDALESDDEVTGFEDPGFNADKIIKPLGG
jgi:hypothetical protein